MTYSPKFRSDSFVKIMVAILDTFLTLNRNGVERGVTKRRQKLKHGT